MYFDHLLFILTLFSHINKKKKKEKFSCSHTGSNEEETYMDRVSFLYIWTNRQIYALRPCIYLATTRRGKKIDKREREREKEREEEKARIRVLPLIFFFADNDIVHSTPLFEWYCLSFPLSFSLNYDGGLHSVLQITD